MKSVAQNVREQGEASFIRLIRAQAAGEDPSQVTNPAFFEGSRKWGEQ
jgi:hypothetical protein